MPDRFIEIVSGLDLASTYLLRGRIEEAGVETQLINENLLAGIGELPMGYATCPRILVREVDVQRAREAIAGSPWG